MSVEKPKRSRRPLILGIIGVLAACGIITVFVSLFSDDTPNPEPAAVVESTAVEDTQEPESTDAPQPVDTVEPTAVPPTSTPEPTNTPEPTETPVPTATATPLPEPIELTGSGDAIVDVEKWEGPALVRINGNAGSAYFSVTSYDSAGNPIDLLVNTTDPYQGERLIDYLDDQNTTRFEVKATGDWAISVVPFSLETVTVADVPGVATGTGDSVVWLSEDADTAVITGNAGSNYFSVTGIGDSFDLLVNTTDPYDGQVLVSPGIRLLLITAVGDWSIDMTAR